MVMPTSILHHTIILKPMIKGILRTFGEIDKNLVKWSMVKTKYLGTAGQNIHHTSLDIHVLQRIIMNVFCDPNDLLCRTRSKCPFG